MKIKIGFLILVSFIIASEISLVHAGEQGDGDALQTVLLVKQYKQRASRIEKDLANVRAVPDAIDVISEGDDSARSILELYYNFAVMTSTPSIVAFNHIILFGDLGITGPEVLELYYLCAKDYPTMVSLMEMLRKRKLSKESLYSYLQTRGIGVDITSIIENLKGENKNKNIVDYLDQIKACYYHPTSDSCLSKIYFSVFTTLVAATAIVLCII